MEGTSTNVITANNTANNKVSEAITICNSMHQQNESLMKGKKVNTYAGKDTGTGKDTDKIEDKKETMTETRGRL